ncbi:phosphate transport system regulatory protein PhoU [Aerococcus sanguinicola]|uniref:Phosphate-specific transport system accessory protein PhoU n=2 Tax=Aerococcaceae TaxID=186827 RepID=A0A2I1MSZ8_9LACT|nr:phosphate transport system regulatory protein PhoU [Aerococcus sanguinicola]
MLNITTWRDYTMSIRKTFDNQLHELSELFKSMGDLTLQAIEHSSDALLDHKVVISQQVIENDDEINEYEFKIERDCYRLIALQQPVANDLRMIASILKATSDLERMGDHAVSIAKSSLVIADSQRLPAIEEKIREMSVKVEAMVRDAIAAFFAKDAKAAKEIAERDHEVDALYKQVHNDIVDEITAGDNADLSESAAAYLSVASNYERLGDYTTNICERVLYMEDGNMVDLNA